MVVAVPPLQRWKMAKQKQHGVAEREKEREQERIHLEEDVFGDDIGDEPSG